MHLLFNVENLTLHTSNKNETKKFMMPIPSKTQRNDKSGILIA